MLMNWPLLRAHRVRFIWFFYLDPDEIRASWQLFYRHTHNIVCNILADPHCRWQDLQDDVHLWPTSAPESPWPQMKFWNFSHLFETLMPLPMACSFRRPRLRLVSTVWSSSSWLQLVVVGDDQTSGIEQTTSGNCVHGCAKPDPFDKSRPLSGWRWRYMQRIFTMTLHCLCVCVGRGARVPPL